MADNIRILSWGLDINLTMVGEFRQKSQQFVEIEGEFLVLNMQEVSYINSTASWHHCRCGILSTEDE